MFVLLDKVDIMVVLLAQVVTYDYETCAILAQYKEG